MNVLALIPARSGSKGIPNKNFLPLAGACPTQRAYEAALAVGCNPIVVSSDVSWLVDPLSVPLHPVVFDRRPAELAQDDTPMIDVVKHALSEVPGPEDQIILLIQPTQPLRQPKHLTAAIQLLEKSGADAVVSVTPLPLTYSPDFACEIAPSGVLCGWKDLIWAQPKRRQDARPAYIRDGTVYAFRRATVSAFDSIYGCDCRALIIDPSETCALDSPEDWAEAERRLRGRDAV